MNVLVPMAGGEDAFRTAGLPHIKSLLEVGGVPLVQHVHASLATLQGARFVFVIRKEDAAQHHLDAVLRLLCPEGVIIQAQGATAGAACTALLAVEHIPADEELVIANGDQVIRADLPAAVADFRARGLDAGTLVFPSIHPRWSYVRVDEHGLVVEAAEKRPISRHATAGFYWFRRGSLFVDAAFEMLRHRGPVGERYFVCPTLNELVLAGRRVGVHPLSRDAYHSLATPGGVSRFERTLADGGAHADSPDW